VQNKSKVESVKLKVIPIEKTPQIENPNHEPSTINYQLTRIFAPEKLS